MRQHPTDIMLSLHQHQQQSSQKDLKPELQQPGSDVRTYQQQQQQHQHPYSPKPVTSSTSKFQLASPTTPTTPQRRTVTSSILDRVSMFSNHNNNFAFYTSKPSSPTTFQSPKNVVVEPRRTLSSRSLIGHRPQPEQQHQSKTAPRSEVVEELTLFQKLWLSACSLDASSTRDMEDESNNNDTTVHAEEEEESSCMAAAAPTTTAPQKSSTKVTDSGCDLPPTKQSKTNKSEKKKTKKSSKKATMTIQDLMRAAVESDNNNKGRQQSGKGSSRSCCPKLHYNKAIEKKEVIEKQNCASMELDHPDDDASLRTTSIFEHKETSRKPKESKTKHLADDISDKVKTTPKITSPKKTKTRAVPASPQTPSGKSWQGQTQSKNKGSSRKSSVSQTKEEDSRLGANGENVVDNKHQNGSITSKVDEDKEDQDTSLMGKKVKKSVAAASLSLQNGLQGSSNHTSVTVPVRPTTHKEVSPLRPSTMRGHSFMVSAYSPSKPRTIPDLEHSSSSSSDKMDEQQQDDDEEEDEEPIARRKMIRRPPPGYCGRPGAVRGFSLDKDSSEELASVVANLKCASVAGTPSAVAAANTTTISKKEKSPRRPGRKRCAKAPDNLSPALQNDEEVYSSPVSMSRSNNNKLLIRELD